MKAVSTIALLLALALSAPALAAEGYLSPEGAPYALDLQYETGALKVFHHTYRVGPSDTATNFDFVNQGGQEILFPYERLQAGLTLAGAHRFAFLYQPLTLETKARFRDTVKIDTATFAAGEEVSMKYGFPFWRLTYSYLFDLGDLELGAGLALQLRNASITFSQQTDSASNFAVSQNLGPVPAFHVSADWSHESGFGLYAEATGLYASSALINGATFEFEGSILDASIRPRLRLNNGVEAFLNLRFLGGTAKGTSQYANSQWSVAEERSTENVLATGSLSLGFVLR